MNYTEWIAIAAGGVAICVCGLLIGRKVRKKGKGQGEIQLYLSPILAVAILVFAFSAMSARSVKQAKQSAKVAVPVRYSCESMPAAEDELLADRDPAAMPIAEDEPIDRNAGITPNPGSSATPMPLVPPKAG